MPTPRSKTKRSTPTPSEPRLREIAQHVVVPKGAVTTGWPAVRAKCRELGISFRPWQPNVGRIILAKRADGKYAATIGGTGLSIPRQVGKTFLVGAIIFALCLLRPKLTVIWTAHRLKTAEETLKKMQAMANRKRIAPYIDHVYVGSGDGEVRFRNGSRILFGARERGFGRGFDEVDVLVFDEGQILTESALDDMIPATNQSRQPEGALLLFMGTPPRPKKDPGEVWLRMRREALSGQDDDTAWVEFGGDEGYEFTPLPAPLSEADWKQIAKANPSYPDDTSRESILRMRKKLGSASFLREGAGVYDKDDDLTTMLPGWPSLAADHPGSVVAAIGLAVSVNGEHGSIAQVDVYGDGLVNVDAQDRRPGTAWMVAEAKRIQTEYRCAVVIDEKCPDATLITALEDAGVDVTVMKLADYVEAWSNLKNRVRDKRLTHQATALLDDALAVAKPRSVGDGREVPGRKASSDDIDMLEAAIAALHGAESAPNYDVLDSIY